MRRYLRAIAVTALALVWGVSAIQLLVPGGVGAVIGGIGGGVQIEIMDESIPLAGPQGKGRTENGWLKVQGGRLLNEAGAPFQLKGISSHGIGWFPQYTGAASIATVKTYGANVFRVAMYVDDEPGNYTTDEKDMHTNTEAMCAAIDNALALNMYVIADWHILEDGNPLNRVDQAVAFFSALSAKYAGDPGVIYEICNEPNGSATWEDIRAYADEVIPAIRANAPDALIIVGTPEYASSLQPAVQSPLPYENVMYAYHYYSHIPDEVYQAELGAALEAGLPVFISEWGVGSGDTTVTEEQARRAAAFLQYAQAKNLSWVNWALCNKDESFSAILPTVATPGGWTEEELTTSGKLVFSALK